MLSPSTRRMALSIASTTASSACPGTCPGTARTRTQPAARSCYQVVRALLDSGARIYYSMAPAAGSIGEIIRLNEFPHEIRRKEYKPNRNFEMVEEISHEKSSRSWIYWQRCHHTLPHQVIRRCPQW